MNWNVVMHADLSDPTRLAFVFTNMKNYLKDVPKGSGAKLVILANGPAVRLFTNARENDTLHATAKELLASGVSLRLCRNALANFNLDEKELWKGCEVVPGGITELVRLQGEGFAYIKP